jgi:CheY-like chemotaxis protein
VTEVADLLGPNAREKGLVLSVEFDSRVPRALVGDALRIRQVLLNLVGNAVKFTDLGNVTIEVTSPRQDESSATVRIAVVDTGIAVPEDKLAYIFERFTQVDTSSSRRHGGTGLGLAISNQLVDLMGGRIGVRSKIGEGSTFWFTLTLPIASAEAVAAAAGPAPAAAMPPRPASARPKIRARVLLVEDNAVNQQVATQVLSKIGCRVDVAANGAAALEKVAGEFYDLVFMDCQMPGMDGLEVTRRIRQREAERGGHLPIVAMTAHAMTGDRERCLEAGMDDYLTKPIEEQVVWDALRAGIAARRPEPAEGNGRGEILDTASLLNVAQGDTEFLKRIADTYAADAPAMMAEIQQAVAAGDRAGLVRAAHALSGALRTLRARRGGELASLLEAMGQAGELEMDGGRARAQTLAGALSEELTRIGMVLQGLTHSSGETRL